MEHPRRPGIATRVRARLRGERTAEALEALRSAGIGIDIELSRTEQVRAQLTVDGQTLWDCPRSVSSHLLAAWNAFLLQTLADGMLDADYQADRGTVGFVPPVTFEQVWAWFSAAEGWLSMAQQAYANPDYNIAMVVHLPAALPAWVAPSPCPPVHLHALLLALPAIREHADLAVYDLGQQATDERQRKAVNAVRQLAAEADAALDYARTLHGSPAGTQLHELIEAHLKRAAGLWFHIGQLAAMPSMIGGYRPKTGPGRVDPETVPGGSRFDPWCLTDPQTMAVWQADPRAREAIDALWAADPDPVRTLTVQAQIHAALDSGAVTPVTGPGQGSYYYGCPWPPIYQVRRRVKIDGKRLSAAQQFTFEVSAEELAQGGQFIRRILLGPFMNTTEVDYGGAGD